MSEEIVKSEKYDKAIKLHTEIIANGQIAAASLCEMCKDLKQMRDEKLYQELGFDTFESYSEEKAGIKARQAYTYITTYENLGKDFLQSNAQLGITKLSMIAALPFYEKDKFIESNNVEDMSSRELKEALEKVTKQGEQISFLQERNEKLTTDKKNALDTISKLNNSIEELESRPIDVAVSEPSEEAIEKIKQEAKEETSKTLFQKNKEIEELTAKLQQADEFKERLKTASNDKVKEFKIYFADCQERLRKLFETLEDVEEKDIKLKLKAGLKAFIDTIKEDLQ